MTDTKGKKILLFGGLGFLVVLFALGIVAKMKTARRAHPKPVAQAQQTTRQAEALYAQAKALIQAKKWAQARDVLVKLAALEPGNDFVSAKLEEVSLNEKAEKDLARAKEKMAKGDLAGAGVIAELVPKESVYYAEARRIARKANEHRAQELVDEAKALKEKHLEDLARKKVEEAIAVAPGYQPALELREQLGGVPTDKEGGASQTGGESGAVSHQGSAASRPARHEGATPARSPFTRHEAPRPPRAGRGRFLGFYKARNWSAAVAELRRMAASQRGVRARRTKALAQQVQAMAQAFRKAEANKHSNSLAAMYAYQKALRLDRRISGGVHAAYIKGQLAKVARAAAGSAFSSGRYAQAYQAARVARQYGGNSQSVARIMAQLESKAKAIFYQGYVLRDRNLPKAKAYWRKVLKMVPPSSPWYKKASFYLKSYGKKKARSEQGGEDEL